MRSTASEVNLSVKDFTRYFKAGRLGKLWLPNGEAYDHPGGRFFDNGSVTDFYIRLDDLYKMVCGWKVNHIQVPLDDIIAIVAFGSAVRYPGVVKIKHTHRRYWLFGEKVTTIEEEPIQPEDADFLVVTGRNLTRDVVLEPETLWVYGSGTWIKKGGIHIINRGVDQVLKGVRAKDTVSKSALRNGVPVFFDNRFKDMLAKTGIKSATSRRMYWDETSGGRLTGKIR